MIFSPFWNLIFICLFQCLFVNIMEFNRSTDILDPTDFTSMDKNDLQNIFFCIVSWFDVSIMSVAQTVWSKLHKQA